MKSPLLVALKTQLQNHRKKSQVGHNTEVKDLSYQGFISIAPGLFSYFMPTVIWLNREVQLRLADRGNGIGNYEPKFYFCIHFSLQAVKKGTSKIKHTNRKETDNSNDV